MRPVTKACRAKLVEFNTHFKGAVIALRAGSFYTDVVRYEVIEFQRYSYRVSNVEYCTVLMTCITDSESTLPCGIGKPAVEGTVESHDFSIRSMEELLNQGSLEIVSNVHKEEWFLPFFACMAV